MMRNINEIPVEYWNKYTDKKVRIKPFDHKSRILAGEYTALLGELLKNYHPEIEHKGSTFFGIAGKGEIEIGVYPREADWSGVLASLTNKYGQPGSLEENYARFNDVYKGTEIEIILMKGREAVIDKKLNRYLFQHSDLLKEYEDVKNKYSYSKKEYLIQKDKFFRKVIEAIPEDY